MSSDSRAARRSRCENAQSLPASAMMPLCEALAQCNRHAQVMQQAMADLPLIDVLNRLERYGHLTTTDWLRWRALRNALIHEYPDQPQIRAALLNEAMDAARALRQLLDRLQQRGASP